MKYTIKNFEQNVNKIIEQIETKQKHQLIGQVINSLQKPVKDVLNLLNNK